MKWCVIHYACIDFYTVYVHVCTKWLHCFPQDIALVKMIGDNRRCEAAKKEILIIMAKTVGLKHLPCVDIE